MNEPQRTHTLENWIAVELQLTAFPDETQNQLDQDWFQQIVGEDFTSTRKSLTRTYEAITGDHAFRLTIDPVRICWSLTAVIDPNSEHLGDLPTLGSFVEAQVAFTDRMQPFFRNHCPPIVRLGFVPRLLIVTDSRAGSQHELRQCLPNMQIDPQSSEFLYRINRRRTSNVVDGLSMNRLATWTSAQITISATAGVAGTEPAVGLTRNYCACLLRLDVNTDAERRELLPHDSLSTIWEELGGLAQEIAEYGDIP